MRKVISITIAVHEGKGNHHYPDMLYALCDDGSLWYASCIYPEEKWTRITGIPQEDTEHLPVKVPMQAHERLIMEDGKTERALRQAEKKREAGK